MRSWRRKFALVCGTSSLFSLPAAAAQTVPAKPPAIALLDSGDLAQWQAWTQPAGWRVLAPSVPAGANLDARVQAVAQQVEEAVRDGSIDPARVYLAGRGDLSAAVFYAVSRVPDLWAAAAALGGSPRAAIDSDRLYAANFTNVPMLWISSSPNDQTIAEQLQSAGLRLEWRAAANPNAGALLDWLAQHRRDPAPPTIDCETDSKSFASCYWIRITKYDPDERNEVLPSTRVPATTRASLDLGEFGFKPDSPGPGVLVGFLGPKYSGPLKVGDRIVALEGREIADAPHYLALMSQITEERPAAVTVERGKERIRLETNIVLPRRVPVTTARVQAQFLPQDQQIRIVSRTITEMRVTVPAAWVPAMLNWNGVPLERVETPGCRLLFMEKAIEHAGACP